MLEDFFIIPQKKIPNHWKTLNMSYEFFALEYCEEELDIPLYHIESTHYSEEGLELTLKSLEKAIAMEDWYIQLGRLSSYARAS